MSIKMLKLHDIFNEAIVRSSDLEQRAYLDEACGNDHAVRARVEALLRAHTEAGGFFGGKSAAESVTIDQRTEHVGKRVHTALSSLFWTHVHRRTNHLIEVGV